MAISVQATLWPALMMLFDEVTSALDPEVISEVTSVIRGLFDQHNLTMLMVTHQIGFAREISDRICLFFDGKIEEQGSPERLLDNPQNERTTRLLTQLSPSSNPTPVRLTGVFHCHGAG